MARENRLANEVRTRLENQNSVKPELKVINGNNRAKVNTDPLAERQFGKPVSAHVREFGALFGTIFFGIGVYRGFYGRELNDTLVFFSLGSIFAVLGYAAPRALLPVWKAWMGLAYYISLVMTFVIMALVWILAFIPMSLVLKLIGKKTIINRYQSGDQSYWITRKPEANDFKRLERQY